MPIGNVRKATTFVIPSNPKVRVVVNTRNGGFEGVYIHLMNPRLLDECVYKYSMDSKSDLRSLIEVLQEVEEFWNTGAHQLSDTVRNK